MGSSEVTRRIILRAQPRTDIADAVAWYGKVGLASDFLRAVEAALVAIQENPLLYQVIKRGIRRAPLRRFRYGLMYVVREDELIVLTCFHDRRDPRRWHDFNR